MAALVGLVIALTLLHTPVHGAKSLKETLLDGRVFDSSLSNEEEARVLSNFNISRQIFHQKLDHFVGGVVPTFNQVEPLPQNVHPFVHCPM